jgi:hypothetical protein
MLIFALACPGESAVAGVVQGKVVLAPMCPGPTRIGQQCAAKPASTTVDVFRSSSPPSASSRPYRRIRSDQHGRFELSLEPGRYWLRPHVPRLYAGSAFAKPVDLIVSDKVSTITLVVDTGMR